MASLLTSARPSLVRPAKVLAGRRSVVVSATSDKPINPAIRKDEPKVVDTCLAKDIQKQAVYCRCWRSDKFPLCDGKHVKHNEATGDNVGPLIVKAE